MENPWSELTDRHKRYVGLATAFGTVAGAVAGGIAGMVVWMLLTGGAITIFGLGITSVKRKEWESQAGYLAWLVVGTCAIAVGLMCCVGALLGLYMHQLGWI